MEFGGVLGLGGHVGPSSSSSETASASSIFSYPIPSLAFKHGRSCADPEEDQRRLKMPKTEAMLLPAAEKAAPFLPRSTTTTASSASHYSLFPDGEQMLSFSASPPSSKPNHLVISNDGSFPSSSSYHHYHHPSSYSSSHFYRNPSGIISGGGNVSMHGVRGPFTPSQWLELEHQALIYKYIDAKAAIPSNLLIPFRRSLNPAALSSYMPGCYRSSTLGWGSFHLGLSGSTDPEPGRCRRTDGKKWRCARDAVADQKYCERHMNRGRHRSRKLVEGRSGQASKAVPAIATPQTASTGCSGVASNGLTMAQQQTKSSQPNIMDPSPSQFNRVLMNKENIHDRLRDSQGFSVLTSVSPKHASSLLPISNQHDPFEGASSRAGYGLLSADSLLNTSRTSYSENISFDSSSQLDDQQSQPHHLRHFIDDWPKTRSEHPPIAWPEVEDMQSDRTQLSISILTDFSSSSNSPNQEMLALSPLRLSREFNAIDEGNQRQTGWIPISWEPTVGGPLGEVLNNTNSTPKGLSKNCSSSSLNLLSDGWDTSSRLEASPTGVLTKTAFGSLSSSTGSSPRAGSHKTRDSTSSLRDDLLGSTLANLSTIPSL